MVRLGPGVGVRFSYPVQAALDSIGRTEDLRFSPNNRLLAFAGLAGNRCLLVRVEVGQVDGQLVLAADDYAEITSKTFRYPHGIDFIDDGTLVVANRGGGVSIVRLPAGGWGGRQREVETLWRCPGGRFRWMRSPGSVVVRRHGEDLIELLICNNYSHRVTRLVIEPRNWRTRSKSVFLRRDLNVPDGIVLSHDGRWIAVSSHFSHEVKLYDAATAGPDAEPAGVLTGVSFPHGLQFTSDDRHLIVADAGAPLIHIYDRGETWSGGHVPSRSIEVLDDETFARGRKNPEEGGPKGIAIDQTGQIVAITNEEQPLALYSLRSLVEDRTEAAMTQSR